MLLFLSFVCLLVIAGCSGSGENGEKGGSSEIADLKVNSGSYVTYDGQENTDDDALLALNISVKNNTDKTLSLMAENLSLYDSEGQQIKPENDVYDDEGNFKLMNFTDLSAGKSATGYVAFRVAKDQTYELRYKPVDFENPDDPEEIVLKIDAKKYKDGQQAVKDATTAFIDTIFFGKENPNYNKLVANNADQEKKQVAEFFKEQIETAVDDNLSDSQIEKIYQDYIKVQGNKGSADLKVISAFPENATIEVTPKVLSSDDVNEELGKLNEQFIDDNAGKYDDYDKANQAWAGYLVDHMDDIFNNSGVETASDTYQLNLKKENDKWSVDTKKSSDNYQYESFMTVMTGGY